MIRESMQSLEARLDPRRFLRVHRSAIVNLQRVREIQPDAGPEQVILLANGARVRLSRSRRSTLEDKLGQAV